MTTIPTTPTVTRTDTDRAVETATTWTELVKAVDAHDGIALVPMETLRRLEGAQRLGVHVLKAIEGRLGTLGLGNLPDSLPNRQDQAAILYRYGTPASEVISAVRNGLTSAQDVKNTYNALYKLNALPETSKIVHRDAFEADLTSAANTLLDLLGERNK